MAGIYLHVPFCASKCRYCDFYSIATLALKAHYLQALEIEIARRSHELAGHTIHTIYWGGGTPSLLAAHEIEHIMCCLYHHFTIDPEAEITIECNPGDYDREKFAHLLSAGINRVSIGVQSTHDHVLRYLGRRHSYAAVVEMIEALHTLGLHNLSLDLIYGIPGTTLEQVDTDLDRLLELSPTHFSTYHLIYEEGTPLYADLQAGRLSPMSEELSLAMAHRITQRLQAVGYEHYEISNYALPHYRSRHNSSYWQGTPYIGLGPSAHSYVAPWRSYNTADLHAYTHAWLDNGFMLREYEHITPALAYEEYLLTRLRTSEGLSLDEVAQLFGLQQAEHLQAQLSPYISRGLLHQVGSRHVLTPAGIDLSDAIISSLF